MKGDANQLVVDASIAMAWCFDDEATAFTEKILDIVSSGTEVVNPAIWPFEIANTLLVAERRKRISMAQSRAFLGRLGQFLITVEATPPARAFGESLSLARQEDLTAYDAAYLEVALRRALPLATLDDKLRRAARRVGVPLV